MTENSFTLSWLAPDNDGGSPIIEYIVERKEANRKAWQRVATTDSKSLSMEVTGLKKDTAYNFRVCCRNEVGYSPYFAPEETITPGLKICKLPFLSFRLYLEILQLPAFVYGKIY